MDVQAWQSRLDSAFLSNGGGHRALLEVFEAEAKHGRHVATGLSGHLSLINSLLSFVLETVVEASGHYDHSKLKGKTCYSILLFDFAMAFRHIRACETLLFGGYPSIGFGILRGLKERVFLMAAIGGGYTTHTQLTGLKPNMTPSEIEADADGIRKRAENEERRAFDAILRQATDLGNHVPVLRRWERLYDGEVHGQRGSGASLMLAWLREGQSLPFFPVYDEDLTAVYLNRVGDLGWILLRLLPLLQPDASVFSASWAERWSLLDASFRTYNDGLKRLNKPTLTDIADAIEAFVDVRLAFSPSSASYQLCKE